MTPAQRTEGTKRPIGEPSIRNWTFESGVDRIIGRDAHGNLVMAIAAGPHFGSRLAAAFDRRGPR